MLKLWDLRGWYIDRILVLAALPLIACAVAPPGLCDPAKADKASLAAKPDKAVKVDRPGGNALYAQIADEGLSGTICSGNVRLVQMACTVAHSDPDGKDWSDDVDGGIAKIFKYIDRQTSKILNLSASVDNSAEDRGRVLYRFGLILRALEEFYLKSNYVELKIAADPAADPYNIEPINWTRVGKDSRAIAATGFKFGEFDKSSVKSTEGLKKFGDATYFSIAKELSVKEAQREWNSLERLIKVRYPQKFAEIDVALKNASSPANFQPDIED